VGVSSPQIRQPFYVPFPSGGHLWPCECLAAATAFWRCALRLVSLAVLILDDRGGLNCPALCHRGGRTKFAGTLAVPLPDSQQSQVLATVRGGGQSVVRRRILDRKSAASREQIFLLSYAVVPEPNRAFESGRRISPSVDLLMVAGRVDFAQVSHIPGLCGSNHIDGSGSPSVALMGIGEKGGRRTRQFYGLAVLECLSTTSYFLIGLRQLAVICPAVLRPLSFGRSPVAL
jgi:hypothetical protein